MYMYMYVYPNRDDDGFPCREDLRNAMNSSIWTRRRCTRGKSCQSRSL